MAAVIAGVLPEERLISAGNRVAALAAWSRSQRALASAAPITTTPHPGLAAARRALRVFGHNAALNVTPWPLTTPAYVVELSPAVNMAIAPDTPWGVLAPLAELMPGTAGTRVTAPEFEGDSVVTAAIDAALHAAAGRPLVIAVRDAHRHAWMSSAVKQATIARSDTIVVEMGVPVSPIGGIQIATFGASNACAVAAAELLAGVAPTGILVEPLLPA